MAIISTKCNHFGLFLFICQIFKLLLNFVGIHGANVLQQNVEKCLFRIQNYSVLVTWSC